jgi:hypothetical protein
VLPISIDGEHNVAHQFIRRQPIVVIQRQVVGGFKYGPTQFRRATLLWCL